MMIVRFKAFLGMIPILFLLVVCISKEEVVVRGPVIRATPSFELTGTQIPYLDTFDIGGDLTCLFSGNFSDGLIVLKKAADFAYDADFHREIMVSCV